MEESEELNHLVGVKTASWLTLFLFIAFLTCIFIRKIDVAVSKMSKNFEYILKVDNRTPFGFLLCDAVNA